MVGGSVSADARKEMASGCAAGMANVLSGFPFDTLKVTLQANPGRYRTWWQCLKDIWRTQGAGALYRGVGPPLIGGALETGIEYLVYSRTLEYLKGNAAEAPMHAVPIAAAMGGFSLSFILGPTELIKCRMQVAGQQYGSSLQCIKNLLETEGLKGVTRGLGATMIREVPGNMLFFSMYEALRRTLPGRPHQGESNGSFLQVVTNASSAIMCGGLAGMGMWAMVLPVDIAKTRLQTAGPGSAWDISVSRHLSLIWKERGFSGFYCGLVPTLLRAFPAHACQWLAWELAMAHLSSPIEEVQISSAAATAHSGV